MAGWVLSAKKIIPFMPFIVAAISNSAFLNWSHRFNLDTLKRWCVSAMVMAFSTSSSSPSSFWRALMTPSFHLFFTSVWNLSTISWNWQRVARLNFESVGIASACAFSCSNSVQIRQQRSTNPALTSRSCNDFISAEVEIREERRKKSGTVAFLSTSAFFTCLISLKQYL